MTIDSKHCSKNDNIVYSIWNSFPQVLRSTVGRLFSRDTEFLFLWYADADSRVKKFRTPDLPPALKT